MTTTHVAMMISVLPTLDQTSVIESHRSVRLRLNAAATVSSPLSKAASGPVIRNPMPTITPEDDAGADGPGEEVTAVFPMKPIHEEKVMPTPKTSPANTSEGKCAPRKTGPARP